MDYLNDLNPEQKKAVEHTEGPLMILAGAGSGKTRVLTYRIAHLINLGVDPFKIMALTFTNKAAKEMKERITRLIGSNESMNVWMGTFHSVFAKILRSEADKLGYPSNFTIYDTDDSKSLIKSIIKELNLDDKVYKPNLVLGRISSAKNNLLSAEEYNKNTSIQSEDQQSKKPLIGKIYSLYVKRCFRAGAMDFDDLLYQTNILLRDFPEVLYKYQDRFEFILVDEFQDTNFSQYTIVKKICARRENICVVGDDAQSIYAFRGANIQNILNFKRDYPDVKTYKLEQNYRSTKTIVQAANSLISKNKNQFKKEVWTQNDSGKNIALFKTTTDNQEGWLVANQIFDTKINQQSFNKDFAILYRTNAQSRAIEEALRKKNIAYRIYGGLSFYKRKEIKDVLAYFRLSLNPKDDEAIKRVINYPKRGIGKTSIEKIALTANEKSKSIWEVISTESLQEVAINNGAKKKIEDFVHIIELFVAQTKTMQASDVGHQIASSSGVLKDLYTDKTPEGLSRHENIQELLNGLKDFEEQKKAQGEELVLLESYMQEISLLTDNIEQDNQELEDSVSLMTIHAAKGLEFPYVFIVGLEENLFPSQLSIYDRNQLEEERRLFYVALTRAEKQLFLSYADTRYRWGKLVVNTPSRFIEEIDPKYIDEKFSKAQTRSNTTEFKTQTPLFGKGYQKRKLTKVAPSQPSSIHTDSTEQIYVGSSVKHQKFGKGKVVHIEGQPHNKKATVYFEGAAGKRQLLLKYAKLEVLT